MQEKKINLINLYYNIGAFNILVATDPQIWSSSYWMKIVSMTFVYSLFLYSLLNEQLIYIILSIFI